MTHSTTETSSYTLSKYSRSYPTSAQTYSDWQHFTNPEIRLLLDVTKCSNSELQEVRLRVLWNINNGSDNQSQVVFEDIELLSFSSLATDKMIDQHQQLQGLPIKAVYRDTLVGIRYLHPKESINTTPTYRRFQVTFTSSAVATELINSICTVCPCKLNATSVASLNPAQAPPRNLITKAMNPPQFSSRLQSAANHDSSLPHTPASTSRPCPLADKQTSQIPFSSPQFISSSQQERDFSQLTSSPYMDQSQPYYTQYARSQLGTQRIPDRHEIASKSNSTEEHSQPYFPESQVFSQDTQSVNNQTSGPISKTIEQGETTPHKMNDKFLSALREFEATELYDLSPDALEQIVGEIVHEKGFPKLLKSLEKLWAIKDLAKIYI